VETLYWCEGLDQWQPVTSLVALREKLDRSQRQACFAGVLRLAGPASPLDELITFAGKFAEEFPEFDDANNDSAYLQLLGGQSVAEAERTAQRLIQKKPEMLAYRTTAALAALRRQDSAGAAALYDGWTIDWSTAPERFKAVYVAAMRAAGRTAEADKVMEGIQTAALRSEERQLAGLP
jgi:hypothetical protein